MFDKTQFQWREPVQTRSRKRVEDILDAARKLSLLTGLSDMKMNEVADKAGVPVGSVYQFFPTRTALIARLYASEMQPIDQALKRGIEKAQSLIDIKDGARALMETTLERVRTRPWLRCVLTAPIIDEAIASADRANTEQNAHLLANRLQELCPVGEPEELSGLAYLICYLWAPVTQLGLSDTPLTREAFNQYTLMLERQLLALEHKGKAQ